MYLKLLILFFAAVSSQKVRYDNFTVYRANIQNESQVKILQKLMENDGRFDFWTEPVSSAEYVTVMAGPESKSELRSLLTVNNITHEEVIPNLQALIETEKINKYTRRNTRSMTWTSYYTLDDIYAWLDDLAVTYPTIVTELIGGSTYEGRVIKGIKISHGPSRRGIFLEGGMHSREWISPATVNYLAGQILTSDDPDIMAAARDFDWYIFPVANPDGYVFSHESNRMWRKNRRPVQGNIFGVDLNRNWNNNWLAFGASTNPQSDAYAGSGPFSEPETRSFSEFLSTIGADLDLYLSFHSFGQLLLLPYGNTTEPLANYQDAISIGRRALGALSVKYNTQYYAGNVAEAIYLATGGSIDWIKEELNVPLVYCYELRDLFQFGFLLPADQILPTGEETMESILEMIHQARRFGVMESAAIGVEGSWLLMIVGMVYGLLL